MSLWTAISYLSMVHEVSHNHLDTKGKKKHYFLINQQYCEIRK